MKWLRLWVVDWRNRVLLPVTSAGLTLPELYQDREEVSEVEVYLAVSFNMCKCIFLGVVGGLQTGAQRRSTRRLWGSWVWGNRCLWGGLWSTFGLSVSSTQQGKDRNVEASNVNPSILRCHSFRQVTFQLLTDPSLTFFSTSKMCVLLRLVTPIQTLTWLTSENLYIFHLSYNPKVSDQALNPQTEPCRIMGENNI